MSPSNRCSDRQSAKYALDTTQTDTSLLQRIPLLYQCIPSARSLYTLYYCILLLLYHCILIPSTMLLYALIPSMYTPTLSMYTLCSISVYSILLYTLTLSMYTIYSITVYSFPLLCYCMFLFHQCILLLYQSIIITISLYNPVIYKYISL